MNTNEIYRSFQQDNFSIFTSGQKSTILHGEEPVVLPRNLQELELFQRECRKKVAFVLPFSCVQHEYPNRPAHGSEDILAFQIQKEQSLHRNTLMNLLADIDVEHQGIQVDISDEDFAYQVEKAKQEIQNGNACQLVLSREFSSQLQNPGDQDYLGLYKKLLAIPGGFSTFLFKMGEQLIMGASPEVHLNITGRKVHKAPLAGTVPKKEKSFGDDLIKFLQDKKERDELGMVTDEELKMLISMTTKGRIGGPYLKEVGAVVHTEHTFHGNLKEGISPVQALRKTLFSPTIVGSPIESAFQLIHKLETKSRGNYGTAVGVLGSDSLMSAIPIRTAVIDMLSGDMKIRAGAGIVQDSVPMKEAEETRRKALGFLGILQQDSSVYKKLLPSLSPEVKKEIQAKLQERKELLSDFYLSENNEDMKVERLIGKKIAIIHTGDDFSAMLGYMVEKMGAEYEIFENTGDDITKTHDISAFDIVILGPGYGDINDAKDPRMKSLQKLCHELYTSEMPILGICLGHQALCKERGMKIEKLEVPYQGQQRVVNIFGQDEPLGFYNSYISLGDGSEFEESVIEGNQLLYQKDKNTVSCQFHPESIMSKNGFSILSQMLLKLNF